MTTSLTSEPTGFFVVLGVCVLGAVVAVGVVVYAAQRAEREDGRWR